MSTQKQTPPPTKFESDDIALLCRRAAEDLCRVLEQHYKGPAFSNLEVSEIGERVFEPIVKVLLSQATQRASWVATQHMVNHFQVFHQVLWKRLYLRFVYPRLRALIAYLQAKVNRAIARQQLRTIRRK